MTEMLPVCRARNHLNAGISYAPTKIQDATTSNSGAMLNDPRSARGKWSGISPPPQRGFGAWPPRCYRSYAAVSDAR